MHGRIPNNRRSSAVPCQKPVYFCRILCRNIAICAHVAGNVGYAPGIDVHAAPLRKLLKTKHTWCEHGRNNYDCNKTEEDGPGTGHGGNRTPGAKFTLMTECIFFGIMIRMDDLTSLYNEHADLSEAKQVQAGKAIPGTMGDAHTDFVQLIAKMIKDKTIDVQKPETFLNRSVFDALDELSRSKVEGSMVNIADMLRHVAEFYISKETPDAAPQLQTMIEQLWQMKDRVEKEFGDVFIF